MAEENLFCDQPKCQELASEFSLSDSKTKTKACVQHRHLLGESFPISLFHFLEAPDDVHSYQKRSDLVQKALATVAAIKERGALNLAEAEQRLDAAKSEVLEVVERSFLEIKARLQCRWRDILQDMDLKCTHFRQLLTDKRFKVPMAHMELYEPVPPTVLRVVVGDMRLAIADVLIKGCLVLPAQPSPKQRVWSVDRLKACVEEQEKAGHADIAEEVAVAVRLSQSTFGPHYSAAGRTAQRKAAKKLRALLVHIVPETAPHERVAEYVEASADARAAGDYEKAWKKTQKGRAVLTELNEENASLCLEAGRILAWRGEWAAADTELRQGLAIEMDGVSGSELGLRLSCALAETYQQAGRIDEAREMCEWALEQWQESEFDVYLLRVLGMLLNSEVEAPWRELRPEFVEWVRKVRVGSEWGQRLLHQFRQISARHEERRAYEDSRDLLREKCPTSFTAALFGFGFALCRYPIDAERLLGEARMMYSVHFPISFDCARCVSACAEFYQTQHKQHEAEEAYLQAVQIFSQLPQSHSFGSTLNNLALLYKATHREAEAENTYQRAVDVFSALSLSQSFGVTLHNLASLYHTTHREPLAEHTYQRAVSAFSALPPCEPFGDTLNNFALLYESTHRETEAEDLYLRAVQVFSDLPPCESFGRSLNALALVYKDTNRESAAEEAYKRAVQVLSTLPPCESLGTTLYSLALLYDKQRRKAEAEQTFQRAVDALSTLPPSQLLGITLHSFALHYKHANREAEAEETYMRAVQVFAVLPPCESFGNTLNSLALLYQRANRTAEAEETHKRAIQVFSTLPPCESFGNTLNSLGLLYKSMRQADAAETTYKRAIQLFSALPPVQSFGIALHNLAVLYKNTHRERKAKETWQRAIQIFSALPLAPSFGYVLYALSKLCVSSGCAVEANNWLAQAKQIASALGESKLATLCDKLLATLY